MKKLMIIGLSLIIAISSCTEKKEVVDKTIKVTKVSLDKNELIIEKTQTAQLIATILPDDATNKTLEWLSSDDSIITVSENGLVTGLELGKANITITSIEGGKTAICSFIVKEQTPIEIIVESIKINSEDFELTAGESKELSATILPENASNKSFSWISSDNTVGMVLGGVLYTYKEGNIKITAISNNDRTSTINVTVNKANDLVNPELIGDWKGSKIELWSPSGTYDEAKIKSEIFTELSEEEKDAKINKIIGSKRFTLTANNTLTMSVLMTDGTYMNFTGEITSKNEQGNMKAMFNTDSGKGKSFYGIDDIWDLGDLDITYDGTNVTVQHIYGDYDCDYDLITYFTVNK